MSSKSASKISAEATKGTAPGGITGGGGTTSPFRALNKNLPATPSGPKRLSTNDPLKTHSSTKNQPNYVLAMPQKLPRKAGPPQEHQAAARSSHCLSELGRVHSVIRIASLLIKGQIKLW